METIEEKILNWSEKQVTWQRNLLKRIIRKEPIDTSYIASTANDIVENTVALETPPLSTSDFSSSDDETAPVTLQDISELKNINALMSGQKLTFGNIGVTLIYGDNGCGKSGYARLIKKAVGARHKEEILADVFHKSTEEQVAKISFTVDGVPKISKWPNEMDSALHQIHFYDEACGDDYIVRKTELKYRPSSLTILDELVIQVDAVRAAIGSLLEDSDSRKLSHPMVPPGCSAHRFLDGLTSSTTMQDLEDAITYPEDLMESRGKLAKEKARLRATDLSKEKKRLFEESRKLDLLATHVEDLYTRFSPESGERIFKLKEEAHELRESATKFSHLSFDNEPLEGIGNITWRKLWEAAENFSVNEAYPHTDFPAVDDGKVCVLCQQSLSEPAQDRLQRFHRFVHNDISARATDAENHYKAEYEAIKDFDVWSGEHQESNQILSVLDESSANNITQFVHCVREAKAGLLQRLSEESADKWKVLPRVNIQLLRSHSDELKKQAVAIDAKSFSKILSNCQKHLAEVEGKIVLQQHREALEKEINRLQRHAKIMSCHTGISTRMISTLSGSLSKTYVTQAVEDYFVYEARNLKLDHVELGNQGATKGKISHLPTLSGVSDIMPKKVLSEGEQTAAGLAGFFTEVHFDSSKSAVILDDPMSSLDHERRGKAAHRIAEIGQDRQVIIFTHDLVFLDEIVKACKHYDVEVTERAIQRSNGARVPGLIFEGHPWKAKDAKARIDALDKELKDIRKDQDNISSDEYERRTSEWAGKLSETWERIIRSEIVYQLIDRGTAQVRPLMFRVAAKVTDEDDKNFQEGYGIASTWVRRHDKSEEVSYMAPTPDEMSQELERILAWYLDVKKYRNQSKERKY